MDGASQVMDPTAVVHALAGAELMREASQLRPGTWVCSTCGRDVAQLGPGMWPCGFEACVAYGSGAKLPR